MSFESVSPDLFRLSNKNKFERELDAAIIKEWLEKDSESKTLRDIVKRIIVEYYRFSLFEQDPNEDEEDIRREYIARLAINIHELREFGIIPKMHIGLDTIKFYSNPRLIAEWVASDMLTLLKYEAFSTKQLVELGDEFQSFEQFETGDHISTKLDETGKEIIIGQGDLWSCINNAKRYLGITEKEIVVDDVLNKV